MFYIREKYYIDLATVKNILKNVIIIFKTHKKKTVPTEY